jgi:hypothetical protein
MKHAALLPVPDVKSKHMNEVEAGMPMKWMVATLLLAAPSFAGQALKPELAGLSFLLGHWDGGAGTVADTGGTSKGSSVITVEVDGGALFRRDHTALFAKDGKAAGAFDQVMLIYSEGGAVRADYTDGSHVIHYVTAELNAGKSVTFTSAAVDGTPTFRLKYERLSERELTVSFSMAPPGQAEFRSVAVGTLKKTPASRSSHS